MHIPIKRFDTDFPLPTATPGAACFDYICRETVTIPPKEIKAIRQNVAIQIPDGYALLVFSRSSTPHKKGLMMANGVGVIDPFYRGDNDEQMIFLYNFTDHLVTVEAGEKLAQGMFVKSEVIEWDEKDHFGEDGHGGYQHTDNKKVFNKD
ncbi:hypothetical protein BGO18_01615 [Candidatus Saccharibacteria bacterium 47-87]|nr:dUTP diphosphatase [Candidatus Saccharibacteria bacterium]OJU96867.1 MAG: hypothetical protein BGO18_01615 [Candidatus Saccharibacteria bacterium 47-87]